jgi:hypothetical protein
MKYVQSPISPARITSSPKITHAYTQSARTVHLNPLHSLNQSSPISPLHPRYLEGLDSIH